MLKKLIIIAIAVQTISIQASDPIKPLTILQKLAPSYWLLGINPNLPLNAQCVGGTLTGNLATTTENINLGLDKLLDAEKVEKASNAAGHGFVYGAVTAVPHAIRDAYVYHPYIAVPATVAAVGGGLYYKFRDLTEEEKQQQQIEKDKRLAQIKEAASVVKADMYADEYRTCLNRHAYDHNASCDDKIRRCHSPARKLAMEAPKRAAKITKAYREYA